MCCRSGQYNEFSQDPLQLKNTYDKLNKGENKIKTKLINLCRRHRAEILEIQSSVIAIINMAQALANAQDRGEGDIDSFEAAREREDTGEGILEREWMDTEEGAVAYEPGAILRAFKRTLDGSSTDEDQTQDDD